MFNLLLSRKSTMVSIGFEKGGFVSNDVYPVLKITPINRLTTAQLKRKKFEYFSQWNKVIKSTRKIKVSLIVPSETL